MKGVNGMPDDYTAQRGGIRGRLPQRGPRGRFPRRLPVRRFPRFFFYPPYYAPPGCDYIDRYGRCCDYYGNCYYDYYGGAPQQGGSDDSVAAWSPSDSWERIDEFEEGGDYHYRY